VLHQAGDYPLVYPLQPVQIMIQSHYWQQRKSFGKQELNC
jgi:hypothetical protein